MLLENGIDRLGQCSIPTLRFVRNAMSAKHNKVKCNKTGYVCSSIILTPDAWEWTDTEKKCLIVDVSNSVAKPFKKRGTIKIKLAGRIKKQKRKYKQPIGYNWLHSCLESHGILNLTFDRTGSEGQRGEMTCPRPFLVKTTFGLWSLLFSIFLSLYIVPHISILSDNNRVRALLILLSFHI